MHRLTLTRQPPVGNGIRQWKAYACLIPPNLHAPALATWARVEHDWWEPRWTSTHNYSPGRRIQWGWLHTKTSLAMLLSISIHNSMSSSVTTRGGTNRTTSPLPAVITIRPASQHFLHRSPAGCSTHNVCFVKQATKVFAESLFCL